MSETDLRMTRPTSVYYLIIGTLLGLIFMNLGSASPTGAQGGKTEVFPVQKKLHRRWSLLRRLEVKWSCGINCGPKTGCLNSVPPPR